MSEPPSTRVQTPDIDSPETTRTNHVQSLMDRLRTKSPIYNFIMSDAHLTSVVPGVVTTRMTLNENHLNSSGNLHGAVSATIIDFVTGLAIASWDLRETTGASVDMHISYLSTARIGDTVEIVSTADKVGGSVAFSSIRISKVEKDGGLKLVTLGQHTKSTELFSLFVLESFVMQIGKLDNTHKSISAGASVVEENFVLEARLRPIHCANQHEEWY
ncbi:unnamed protein product [Fusarium equiseti]|uniref:Thioesterase domain-containing protein n=1 Tax=Fusarium equiseti TaxID=61235 RepID=A0A8J2IQD3_FUSEQ|nr:unnamed protein product [Fusarium equiseti]